MHGRERAQTRAAVAQALAAYPLHALAGARWIAWLLLASALLHPLAAWLPTPPWPLVVVLGAETYGVLQTKVPYVTPHEPDNESGAA